MVSNALQVMSMVVPEPWRSIASGAAPSAPWGSHAQRRGCVEAAIIPGLLRAEKRAIVVVEVSGSAAAGYWPWKENAFFIEKETGRDKICGDAVGGKSLSHVKELSVKRHWKPPHFRVTGIVFSSPKGHNVRVALPEEDVQRLAGYSLLRQQLTMLFNQVSWLKRWWRRASGR